MQSHSAAASIAKVREIARDILPAEARNADRENRLPIKSIEALQAAGLFGFSASETQGEAKCDMRMFSKVAQIIGEQCLATAFIWVQHIQQLALLVEHGNESASVVIQDVARNGSLLASITTEEKKGGELLHAYSSLSEDRPGYSRVRRIAPMVAYGEKATWFLVTMRASSEASLNCVNLVAVHRDDPGEIAVTGDWESMGMVGTRSVPMLLDVVVPNRRILHGFKEIAIQSMIPFAHVGWSSMWFGAARGAYERFVAETRKNRSVFASDLFTHRLARIRLLLDTVSYALGAVISDLEAIRAGGDAGGYSNPGFNIKLNNLKILAAESCYEAIERLVELAGLFRGYLAQEYLQLERVFRDLRSASLMLNNDRLLEANGKMIMLEGTALMKSLI